MSVECSSCHGKGFIVKGEQTCPNCNGVGKVKSVNLIGMSERDLKEPPGRRVLPEVQGQRKDTDTRKVPGMRRHGKNTDVRDLRQACTCRTGTVQQLQERIPGIQARRCLRCRGPGPRKDLHGHGGEPGGLRRVRHAERPDKRPHPLEQRATSRTCRAKRSWSRSIRSSPMAILI